MILVKGSSHHFRGDRCIFGPIVYMKYYMNICMFNCSCNKILRNFDKGASNRVNSIVTGDESWIYAY